MCEVMLANTNVSLCACRYGSTNPTKIDSKFLLACKQEESADQLQMFYIIRLQTLNI